MDKIPVKINVSFVVNAESDDLMKAYQDFCQLVAGIGLAPVGTANISLYRPKKKKQKGNPNG